MFVKDSDGVQCGDCGAGMVKVRFHYRCVRCGSCADVHGRKTTQCEVCEAGVEVEKSYCVHCNAVRCDKCGCWFGKNADERCPHKRTEGQVITFPRRTA
jgi:hypothetical protein